MRLVGFGRMALGAAVLSSIVFAAETQPAKEMVAAYSVSMQFGADDKRASAVNPADPKKSYQLTYFVIDDGRLWFKEMDAPSEKEGPEVHFTPNPTKEKIESFPTAKQVVTGYKDVVARTIGQEFVAYVGRGARGRLTASPRMRAMGLDDQTQTAIDDKCKQLTDMLISIDKQVATGQVEGEKYKELLAALKEYRDSGAEDIARNVKKQDAARKVMTLGLAYLKIVQARKMDGIEKFCAEVGKLLTDEQKKKLLEYGAVEI